MFNPERYNTVVHYPSQLNEEALKNTCFQRPLTKDQQVLEVGCGTGHFAKTFLLPRNEPCRRLVATDVQPDMVDFARQHFPHPRITYDVLDIATLSLNPFLKRHRKFDRVFSFLAFQMIQDQRAAYSNVAELLNDGGECLVLAFTSIDTVDVWSELYKTDKWRGSIPDPRKVFSTSFNFYRLKSAEQIEAEIRDTLRETGLQCISCKVYDIFWKFDDMDSLLGMFQMIYPFKETVPQEEWQDFLALWAELMFRKLSASPGQPLELMCGLYSVHARRALK